MFHVKRIARNLNYKGMIAILLLCFALNGCVGARPSIQIPDYILVPNGKDIIGHKGLTAFIFENINTKLPIEQYLSAKLKSENYAVKEYWVTIEKDKYKIIIYDNADFEKFFNSANYAPINVVPDNVKNGDARKFIAISMINASNEDCLADGSLFQNMAVKYLKILKDEYYHQ